MTEMGYSQYKVVPIARWTKGRFGKYLNLDLKRSRQADRTTLTDAIDTVINATADVPADRCCDNNGNVDNNMVMFNMIEMNTTLVITIKDRS